MNLQEFAALKVGDKIENNMLGPAIGTVTDVTKSGVRVSWGGAQAFFYSVNTTAWMHWTIKP